VRSVGFLRAASPSGEAVRSGSAAPCRVERRGMTLRASRRVPYYMFPRKWSPPNERAGSPLAATSMTRAVGSSALRRVSRRVSVGVAVRSELFGARAGVFSARTGIRVGAATLAQAGVEGEQTVATGGCQCAVRVICDPYRSAGKAEPAWGASLASGKQRRWCAEGATLETRQRARLGFARQRQG